MTVADLKEYFDDIPIEIKCPHCGAYGCSVSFDLTDPNNTEIRYCGHCNRHFGYRLNLTTTVDYFSCELLDLEDHDNPPRAAEKKGK